MSSTDDRSVAEIRDALRRRVNADGGWGYYDGHGSRIEPTCWALLGLHASNALDASAMSKSAQLFRTWQRSDGLLLETEFRDDNRPNVAFNGLAAWLLVQRPDLGARMSLSSLVDGVSCAKGMRLRESTINRQDDALQGWAWIDGTFSWVEPTCWALLALKAAASLFPVVETRINEGERLLIDRCCSEGGWNYGNSNMLGQNLRPYVSTTALALMAMKERKGEACVQRSITLLRDKRLAEPSAMALGLAILALRTFGEAVGDVRDMLLAQWRRTEFLGNAHLMGLALYSLG
jgi:hypothetical protein